IKPEYRHLLTSNSVFWAEGGAKVQLNGSGLTVQASPPFSARESGDACTVRPLPLSCTFAPPSAQNTLLLVSR
ncbi:hypothetical protein V7P28_45800, partial [Klebsiella michiganensis]